MVAKIQKNIRITEKLNKQIRHQAIENNETDSALITRYIEEGLKKDSNQTTLDLKGK